MTSMSSQSLPGSRVCLQGLMLNKEGYASIGGGSPLRKMTDEQANALKMALESKDMPVNVYVGMRYWFPFTEEAVHQLRDSTNTCNPLYDCNCFPVHFGAKTYCQGLTRKWPGG
ncbi:ferrochelatase-1, chloroplastic-like isoform X2 [Rosa rugosa]|uniref:ferrochelatase-1, chloroplastic-like isoform X2 n=1 Tax=Rosa rugosa TaxID=74645 RepID=UPI002B405B3D|nr:ferrochelatase-1, chloroplastic-like isoform X2 [Rosa rugosa]